MHSRTAYRVFAAVILSSAALRADDPTAWRLRATRTEHGARCRAVAFSPDGHRLATAGGGGSGEVKLWNVQTGEEVAAWSAHGDETRAIVFSPDSKTLATGGGTWKGPGEFSLWDVARQIRTGHFQVAEAGVLALAYSPDGQTLAVGGGFVIGGSATGVARLWDVARGKEAMTVLQRSNAEFTSLAFSHAGQSLTASTFRTDQQTKRQLWELRVWDAKTGQEQPTLDSSREQPLDAVFFNLRTLVVSHDGHLIAAGGRSGERGLIKVWNATTGAAFVLPEHAGTVWAVAITADGKVLATADSGSGAVRLWDVASQKELPPLAAFPGAAFSMAFSSDGTQLVAGGVDSTPGHEGGVIKWWIRE